MAEPKKASTPSRTGRATVSRSQVLAAKGRIVTDRKLGRPTPDWVRAVANAKPLKG